ncbi:MAG: hypothetical protein H6R02_896 [Burkholderiaceae bacterium]|jgi:hypothetical protein|nr:hypothetical protein [Burkholderiaceae bacterium]
MAEFGAFAFGVVIGWFTYFTNRYRTGGVEFSDITTLVGVIGGGAVTALFGDARSALFGAYGLGLAVGFFAYFAALVVMVQKSDGVFTWTWFLDGRRKAPKEDETTDGSRGGGTAMAMELPGAVAQTLESSAMADVVSLRDRSVQDTFAALRDLTRRIGSTDDADERPGLVRSQVELTTRQNELLALRLREVADSAPVRDAIAELRKIADELSVAAGELDSSTDAFATATTVLDRVTRVIGILKKNFA